MVLYLIKNMQNFRSVSLIVSETLRFEKGGVLPLFWLKLSVIKIVYYISTTRNFLTIYPRCLKFGGLVP